MPWQTRAMSTLRRLAVGAAVTGAACVAYGAGYEVHSFRLRRIDIPALPAGQPPVTLLHISDLHLTPGQRRKVEWVQRLALLNPDAVVVTGDFLSHPEAVPTAMEALDPLFARPGMFVFGSNDYFAPTLKNPARYLCPDRDRRLLGAPLPWRDLRDGLVSAGWYNLNNARVTVKVDGREWDVRGVNDPHIKTDRYDEVAGEFDAAADLALGVVHAPYRRVLNAMSGDGAGLILAGHTHGGQLAIPGFGALVTNCDLDRRKAKGVHRHDDSWVHVSAGLGTSRYAPIRFACPPEATLLTLRSAG